ncbi:hypothetical protein FRB90_011721, partial [Tulasnella sp. 427]
EALGPFPNYSTYLHAKWLWKTESGTISAAANQELIDSVYSDKNFHPADVAGMCFSTLRTKVAEYQPSLFLESDSWKESAVEIAVPLGVQKGDDLFPASAKLHVPGLQHRSIVDVVKRVLTTDPNVCQYHFHPFRQFSNSSSATGPTQRVVDDIFNSDAMIKEYESLRRSPKEQNCSFERVVLALQFWSDATQLANFGSAKLWPVYMYFGNQPKWARARSDMHSCHDIAHIPSLPESFQDFVCHQRGYPADSQLKTHCRQELFHGVWRILLDRKFIRAYKHGIVIAFPDGSIRRVYLRIITYSADYPEKVIIATIRNLGVCLCPRCLIRRHEIRKLGLRVDTKLRLKSRRVDNDNRRQLVQKARKFIYQDRKGVGSNWVEALLGNMSLTPTENAFSGRLHELGFDFFSMLCSDFMHEFELGEWKALLIHLIRMLNALGGDKTSQLNERFRRVPPFGRDTIRKIIYNVSELKQLAARAFEDILQCAIPAFEGLFPEAIDTKIQELLFVIGDWHSLAKLRLHTDSTISQLETATQVLGQQLRHFEVHVAMETPQEKAARLRRGAPKASTALNASMSNGDGVQSGPKEKAYSLDRYKLHALGDYPSQIRLFGSLDVISTQMGEARHRQKKRQYARTNKRNFEKQIATQTQIAENIRYIESRVNLALGLLPKEPPEPVMVAEEGRVPLGSLEARYWISEESRAPVNLSELLRRQAEDPAFRHFRVQFLDHVLARLRGVPYSWDDPVASSKEYSSVELEKDRIYAHGTAQFNYTTYDIRRAQDTIKPGLRFTGRGNMVEPRNSIRSTIMLSADETDGTPSPPDWVRLDMLWIRWFGADPDERTGLKAKRLERIGYVPNGEEPGAFGFIDPADVIRACHLCPAFDQGTRQDLLHGSKSVAFDMAADDAGEDFELYYAMRFVDRDMAMRHRGGGMGHIGSAQCSEREAYSEGEDDGDSEMSEDQSERSDVDDTEPSLGIVSTFGIDAEVEEEDDEDVSDVNDDLEENLAEVPTKYK